METHRFCVDGRFVGNGQQPICFYDDNGNYSVFDPTISGNTPSDNVVFEYDNTGKAISGVIGTITGVRVPPNAAVIGKTGPTDIKTLVTVGGEYLRDVSSETYNAYGMVRFTGGLTNLYNLSYSAPQSWDGFKQSCQNRSVTAQMCQQFGVPGDYKDYNADQPIQNEITTNTSVYSDRWIIYLLMAIFGVIILFIVGFAGYKYSVRKSESIPQSVDDEEPPKPKVTRRKPKKDNQVVQKPPPPVEYTTITLPKTDVPKPPPVPKPTETPAIYIDDF